MGALIIDGLKNSEIICDEIKTKVSQFPTKPKLVAFYIGKNKESELYLEKKKQKANELGIDFELKEYKEISDEKLVEEIEKLNFDDSVSGIMIQLPLPEKNDINELVKRIVVWKDVECMNPYNRGLLDNNETNIIPPSPAATISLLSTYSIPLKGSRVAILGTGELVGKPLAKLLINAGATVFMCNKFTDDLKEITLISDIVITAVGKNGLLKKDMIKKDAVLVSVGVEVVDGETKGDFDLEDMKSKASYIVPPKKGIGPMTVAFLFLNTIICHKYLMLKDE